MQLWSTALCILLTTQVEALLTRHLAVCTSAEDPLKSLIANHSGGPFFHGGRKVHQPQVTLPSGGDCKKAGFQKTSLAFFPEFAWGCGGSSFYVVPI